MIPKIELRKQWLQIRKSLPFSRRKEAAEGLVSALRNRAKRYVLSFSSTQGEIETRPLNELLAHENRLLLPKVVGNRLTIHLVSNLTTDLAPSAWGIMEPIAEKCPEIPLDSVHAILVPGLAFDKNRHRLGFGKGYYDRLLAEAPIPSIGIGFIEQRIDELPIDPWDIPLDNTLLL